MVWYMYTTSASLRSVIYLIQLLSQTDMLPNVISRSLQLMYTRIVGHCTRHGHEFGMVFVQLVNHGGVGSVCGYFGDCGRSMLRTHLSAIALRGRLILLSVPED